ncbi:MAG: hypothetical protein AXW17_02510 [Colwellia sp. Phe_37]|nr:MAG: hypothetical protein AXW17_02510 [Colwellia sp. Phe_37]
MSKASLVSNDKNNIDLVLSPIKTKTPLSEVHINELIENSEYSNLYVNNSNIKNAIAELNSVLKTLSEDQAGREIKYQVLERRDATISISIEKDNMSASAEISTALGGQHMSAKAILNAAQAANVCKGFSKEQLIKLAKQAAKEPAGSIVKSEIAHGKLPIDGKDSRIKLLVESAQDRILKPKKREDGSVDMRDLGDIICVKVGDPLAKKIPLTDGIQGYTVTGEILEPKPGEDIDMHVGEGTSLSPKNNSILVSTKVGLPRIIENGMEVDSVYQLKNVDVSTGHVKFEGSVIIAKLAKCGFDDVYTDAKAMAGAGSITRAHFARVLLQRGGVSKMQSAFDKYIGKGQRAYVNPNWCSIEDAVATIHAAGGVAVMAHPIRYDLSTKWLRRLIVDFKAAQGDGLEVVLPQMNNEQRKLMLSFCLEYDLHASMGSDFHQPSRWSDLGRNLVMPEQAKGIWQLWQATPSD